MKTRWLFTLALAVAGAASQLATAQTPAVTGIAHVAYRTGNGERESTFLAKLGYLPSFNFTTSTGAVSQIFFKINDRQFIEVYLQTDPAQPLGWLHVCYEADDLTAYVAALTRRGLTPGAVHKAGAGNLITAFSDPDGRTTEFTQYMPGSRHMLDQGLHLGANRISTQIEGIGFAAPDMNAARKFYADGMGFATATSGNGLHIRVTNQPAPWIELAPAGSKPALYLLVSNLKTAEAQARAVGLDIEEQKNSFSVADPDGNLFVFVESSFVPAK
jgi:catechol 2,3-dioxygenase-like lactoylglutathione lyase family enzyme